MQKVISLYIQIANTKYLKLQYFQSKKDKSLCEFYVLKKDDIPIKLIVIDGTTAKEIDIMKYDDSIESEQKQADIQNNTIHTSEEKISIEHIKYTGKNGMLMNIYLNEHHIASYIQIYKYMSNLINTNFIL